MHMSAPPRALADALSSAPRVIPSLAAITNQARGRAWAEVNEPDTITPAAQARHSASLVISRESGLSDSFCMTVLHHEGQHIISRTTLGSNAGP